MMKMKTKKEERGLVARNQTKGRKDTSRTIAGRRLSTE